MHKKLGHRVLPALFVAGAVFLAASGGCGSGNGTSSAPPNYILPIIAPSATPTATPTPSESPTATPTPIPSPSLTPTDGPETARGSYQDLRYTFTVPKHNYAVGEIVPMTFTIQNTGTTDATLQKVSPTFVDATIQTLDGKNVSAVGSTEITDTKKAAMRLTQIYRLVVAAGQTRTFSLQWDQTNRFNPPTTAPTQTAPGTYVLTGEIAPSNLNGSSTPGLPAPPVTITIQ